VNWDNFYTADRNPFLAADLSVVSYAYVAMDEHLCCACGSNQRIYRLCPNSVGHSLATNSPGSITGHHFTHPAIFGTDERAPGQCSHPIDYHSAGAECQGTKPK
jgi:hypothetical protein